MVGGVLIILPEGGDVWNKDNVARVKRDEERAKKSKEEEEERTKKQRRRGRIGIKSISICLRMTRMMITLHDRREEKRLKLRERKE